MNLFQAREQAIFETLKQIKGFSFVLIGGYAVNAYTLPRFSVDCDIVVMGKAEARRVEALLKGIGYKDDTKPGVPCQDNFMRYEKEIEKGINVSMDILIGKVLDRQTGASFDAGWIFENSAVRALKGKTITERLDLRIVDVEALIALKFAPARITDIRDIFMLLPLADAKKVREGLELNGFSGKLEKVREKVVSEAFRNNLQGVYGFIDKVTFEKHKKALLEFGKVS